MSTGTLRSPSIAALLLVAVIAAAPAAVGGELTLAGLRPGRDRLAQAIKLFGKRYTEAYENTPDLLLWADPKKQLYVRVELTPEKVIDAVTVSSYGPEDAPASTLPALAAASGRGLRLGDPMEKTVQLYGQPYFQGPSTEGGRELTLMVHKFSASEDQPQVLETSYDPRTRRLVKITLSFPYY